MYDVYSCNFISSKPKYSHHNNSKAALLAKRGKSNACIISGCCIKLARTVAQYCIVY